MRRSARRRTRKIELERDFEDMTEAIRLVLDVSADEDSERLDRLIAARVADISRSYAQDLIKSGDVRSTMKWRAHRAGCMRAIASNSHCRRSKNQSD